MASCKYSPARTILAEVLRLTVGTPSQPRNYVGNPWDNTSSPCQTLATFSTQTLVPFVKVKCYIPANTPELLRCACVA